MYKDFMILEGTLETVEEINEAYTKETGDPAPFFDADSEEWRAWVEHRDGKTVILEDSVE